jgi:hypothetical protein
MTALCAVMGIGSISAAVVMASRSDYVAALVAGAFGVASGSWLVGEYLPHPGERVHIGRVPVRGNSQPAVVVPVRARKSRAGLVGVAAMGIVSLGLGAFPGPVRLDETLLVRLFWLAVAVILAIGVRNGLRRWRQEKFYLAFTPSGIVEEGITGSSFVPWDAVESVYPAEMYGQPLIGLNLRDPSAVEFRGGAEVLRHLEGPMTGHQHSYMVAGMPASPEWLMSTMRRYLDDKGARAEIGRRAVTGA